MRPMRTSIGAVMVAALCVASCASAGDDKQKSPPKPAHEVVSGSAQIRGGGMRMDVQVGGAFVRRAVQQGDVVVQPSTPVTP